MDNKEIALQIVLAAIEKGYVAFSRDERTPESIGQGFADLYNAILANLAE